MKTKQIITIVIVSIFVIALLTNPTLEEHKSKVKEVFTAYYQKSLKESEVNSENGFAALGSLLGKTMIDNLVESAISRENYIFFSITKATHDGKEKSIGYGIFGNVFLDSKIEDSLNINH